MFKKIGVDAIHSSSKIDIENADRLILPGVGAFDHGMKHLQDSGLVSVLNHEVLEKKKPILGICLGMQLLLEGSEEGQLPGLGWIKGKCRRFTFQNNNNQLKVPHMGWNVVQSSNYISSQSEPQTETRYYFVHSYHAVCDEPENILATAHHGYPFPAIIGRDHILGAQFHPEKSHKFGMNFLKNFVERPLC